jgi:uncharacterized protein (TIGR03032 family)
LWLLQSGTGELGYIDKGAFVPVSFHAGYPRGLSFMGDYALVGLSKDREKGEFDALPLGAALKAHDADAGCGIDVIDHATGERVHFLRFEDTINELYDVVPLPGCRNPQLIGINDDDIRTHYAIDIGGARGQAGA